jgi:hypothetical protein
MQHRGTTEKRERNDVVRRRASVAPQPWELAGGAYYPTAGTKFRRTGDRTATSSIAYENRLNELSCRPLENLNNP